MHSERISMSGGFGLALRLWKLVLALWLVQVALAVPADFFVADSIAPEVGRIGHAPAAAADRVLTVLRGLCEISAPVLYLGAGAVVLAWLWGIVWRGGVVSWRLWAAEDGVRLAQIIGLGLVAFWRYFRLSVLSNLVIASALAGLWYPLWWVIRVSYWNMNEARMQQVLVFGLMMTAALLWVCRAGMLRAAWLLGRPDRRSAARALASGLLGALAHPIASLVPVALWGGLAVAATALPLVAGYANPILASGWPAAALTHVSLIAAAAFRLVLFASFAQVSGLVKQD